jgi:hypothetical protein
MELTDVYVKLVQQYANLWHSGRVPEDRVKFIARILEDYMSDTQREISGAFTVEDWIKQRETVAGHLAEACDCVARQQAATWQN